MSDSILKVIEICVPVLIALIPILPTIVSAGKKTRTAVEAVDKKLDDHIQEQEFADAKACRTRILRFYDEICEGKLHSENHFEDILEDIDKYEAFTRAHPDFPNNKGQLAMKHIKDVYEKCKLKNSFLVLKEK